MRCRANLVSILKRRICACHSLATWDSVLIVADGHVHCNACIAKMSRNMGMRPVFGARLPHEQFRDPANRQDAVAVCGPCRVMLYHTGPPSADTRRIYLMR